MITKIVGAIHQYFHFSIPDCVEPQWSFQATQRRSFFLMVIFGSLLSLSNMKAETQAMNKNSIVPPKVIFLDVNETLLDLKPLKTSVSKALDGNENLLSLWFSTMLHYSLVDTLTGKYNDFSKIGVAALMMVAESNDIELERAEAEEAIIPVLRSLPPHPDVIEGLKQLKSQRLRLVSLTNSSNEGVKEQFENAGLIDIVGERLTVDGVEKFKPHQDVYKWALKEAGVEPGEAMMVAAHAWDIAGAKAAGLRTVFVARPGKVTYPLADAPDYTVKDIRELADRFTQTNINTKN